MGHKNTKPDFKELSKGTRFTTKELKDWFKKFENDYPKGHINRKDFIALYDKMFGTGEDADEFCDLVFKAYDLDGNGFIDFRELVITLSVVAKGTIDEKLFWAFKIYDIDGNNYLTQAEILVVLEAIYKAKHELDSKLKAAEITKDIFKNADENRDEKISLDEFVKHAKTSKCMKEMMQCL